MRSHHLRAAASGGLVNPFDSMSNFPGASRVGSTDVIYYRQSGTYSFTDPNGGLSKFRFTTVGGGGSSTGDGYGYWFSVTGGGGGGAARGEIQTSQTLGISVAQGGYSPGASGVTATSVDQTWTVDSITGNFNEHYRVSGRGGVSIVKASDGTWLIYGTGGMPGLQGYPSSSQGHLSNWTSGSVGYGSRNGGQGFWQNGGFGTVTSGGGVTVTNSYTEFGGMGGPGAHKQAAASNPAHPLEGTGSNFGLGQPGQNTTYAGPGGGGGADGGHTYGSSSVAAAGGAGGTASSLNALLSGSGYASNGGNGTGYSTQGNPSTRGTLGGGCGGNAGDNADTWLDSFEAATGVVVVEFLNASELGV